MLENLFPALFRRKTSFHDSPRDPRSIHEIVDSIPASEDAADEISQHVGKPNQKIAAEIAEWAVKAYLKKIEVERIEGGAIIECPYHVGFQVHFLVENILIKKGWFYSHNFANNTVYLSKTTPRESITRGPAPFY